MTLNMDTQGNSEEKKNSKKEEKENFIQKTGIESKVEREEDTVTGGNFLKPSIGSFNELNTSKKRQREKRTFHAVLSNKKSKQNKQRKAEEYDDEEKQGEKQNRFTKETFDLQAQDIIDTYATASHNYQSPCCIQYLTELVKQAMKDLKKKGMIINKANVPAFAAAVKPVYKSYSDKYGSDMINAILNTK